MVFSLSDGRVSARLRIEEAARYTDIEIERERVRSIERDNLHARGKPSTVVHRARDP